MDNDHWISTPHRVLASLNNNPARQSIAYFCQINPDEIVTCIPTCSSKNKSSKYPPIRSWDLIMQKYLASTQKNK
ncbi:unnamed protein product [Adineta steineri]|uniref:Isopenicillin N synthase-like Fe(2+) 2OG dioxygenase domain-containing protein n=1 Tax=Adineta steineri TaxID=433720 RepID=A0A813NXC5_9BILA|nr:unnamed protein product [Adineta steineri]CAF3866147.1 unnamed protein product [Adineta steineri]